MTAMTPSLSPLKLRSIAHGAVDAGDMDLSVADGETLARITGKRGVHAQKNTMPKRRGRFRKPEADGWIKARVLTS
jgi:hypothetical protein